MSPNDAAAIGATTAMRVAADLRLRILRGELAPGVRLKIDDIANTCQVSHMPVRDALHVLEREGVLDIIPHRGALIRPVDARFVRNLYDLRAAIEGMLTERCAELIDDEGVAELQALVDAHELASKANDALAMVQTNRRLHDVINRHADNDDAVRVLSQGRLLIEAIRVRFGFGQGRSETIIKEHRQILAAIKKRDAEKAGQLARNHCRHARDDLLNRI